MEETYIFHETQEGLLCGQHCLNNLLQQSIFTAIDLSDIAIQLDAKEREIYADRNDNISSTANRRSENVDNSGNFSFGVLQSALQSVCEVELISWTGEEGRERGDPTEEAGFIINRQSHWFALRKVKDHFWNLDSLLNRPEHISAFYLTALLSQFREDGCSVFLIRGTLLEAGVYRYGDYDAPQWVVWWRESQLLSTNTATNTSQQETLNGHLRVAGLGREEDNDDDELMLAIAMSESLA